MQQLQGTYPGWLLDDNKIQINGWTDSSFTASSDSHEQLPMGFNYKANQFLLQQDWLRIDRAGRSNRDDTDVRLPQRHHPAGQRLPLHGSPRAL